MRSNLNVLKTSDWAAWLAALRAATAHDVYHSPTYHRNAELRGEGTAYLLHYRDDPYSILLPLLVRSLEGLDGLGASAAGFNDATSVYGYAGPIASHPTLPVSVRNGFHDALRGALSDMKVVSLFARLHPLLEQEPLVAGLGECRHVGETVSIDLRAPAEEHWKQCRVNHKRAIARLTRMGAAVIRDTEWLYLDDFLRFYRETMHRTGASPYYFFEKEYFAWLATAPELHASLFVCLYNQRPVCCGLFTAYNGFVQYLYSGTADDAVKLSPMKLLLHHVRDWAVENGYRVLHLGGGLRGRRDSLFQFKAGFSPLRHRFCVWCWVLEPQVYDRLTQLRRQQTASFPLASSSDDSFPAYRANVHDSAVTPCTPPLNRPGPARAGRSASG